MSAASVRLVDDGADVLHDLLPAFAHLLEGRFIPGQDEAGMDEAKPRAGFDLGQNEGDDSVKRGAVAGISLMPAFQA